MTYKDYLDGPTWRDDTSMINVVEYRKKFAWFPIKINDDKIWLKRYYSKYRIWANARVFGDEDDYKHTDFIENVTTEEYIVRKLAENL
ncbi:MAG TPA: hypothetical protein VIY47_10660 [Ignavibacteriaceae bacterium]